MSDELEKIAIFRSREIRKQLHDGDWWFVINDVVAALTDTNDPSDYLKKMRARDDELAQLFVEKPVEKGGGQIDPPLAASA
jgi:prophage antirepressor-like protein